MSLPPNIIRAFSNAPGFDEEAFRRVHDTGEQVASVRINPAKFSDPAALSFELGRRIPWTAYGYYLAARPFYTFEPLLHAGAFYVQEASSMFLEQALQQTVDLSKPLRVLDLSAAPGGKSTHIQSLLHPESILVSNEVIKSRAAILEENMIKWGGSNVVVTNNDPRDFSGLQGYFDVIVVDAPCSGSGMFRKDPDSVAGWSNDLVALCSQRQQRILADIWPALKEEGVLIYSTCSYSVEEDEQLADWVIETFEASSLPLLTDSNWNIIQSFSEKHQATGYRFYPDKLMGEGFYLTVFRKTSASSGPSKKAGRGKWEQVPRQVKDGLKHWMKETDYSLISLHENIIALPPLMAEELPLLQSLYIRKAGVTVGKWAGKDLVPDHAFALSHLTATGIPVLQLEKAEALNYLRKEEIKTDTGQRGWCLVQYMGHTLGWIKVLQNRSNNYYPKEWRILKQV